MPLNPNIIGQLRPLGFDDAPTFQERVMHMRDMGRRREVEDLQLDNARVANKQLHKQVNREQQASDVLTAVGGDLDLAIKELTTVGNHESAGKLAGQRTAQRNAQLDFEIRSQQKKVGEYNERVAKSNRNCIGERSSVTPGGNRYITGRRLHHHGRSGAFSRAAVG
jgi:hypothetical protein